MHTVELFEQTVTIAHQLGYSIRQEWLGGGGGGLCEYGGRRWIFVDLAATSVEQLEQVASVLRADQAIHITDLTPAMRQLLDP